MTPISLRSTGIVGGFNRHSCTGILLALALTSVATIARAQQYFVATPDENARGYVTAAQSSTKDPATYAAKKQEFDDYFKKYYFPSMTQTDADKLARIGKLREDLFKTFLLKTTNAQLQSDLTALTLAEMKTYLAAQNPPCHPTTRYNAILVVGMLNDQYGQPPKPSVAANKVLTIVVDSATKNSVFPPPVILGALIGLERHAQLSGSLPPESVKAMSAALLKLVTTEKPIQEMDRDTYSWLRLRAASALAKLKSAGEQNAVNNAIVKLAATSKSLDDRCEAAGLLENLTYKDVKLDDANTAEPLFALARDLAAAEDKRAQDFQERGSGGGVMPVMPIGRGEGSFSPTGGTAIPETFPRRHVLSRLKELYNGLNAVKPSLPTETQKKADAVLAALNTAIASASSKDTVELNLTVALQTMAKEINAAIPGPVKPADEKAKEAVF